MMPPGHGCVGKSSSSGNLVDLFWRQTNLRPFWPFDWPALFVVGLPTVMRKPYGGFRSIHSTGYYV